MKNTYKQDAFIGPYVIIAVRNNGAIRACKGRVTNIFNIQNLIPDKEEATVHHGAV